MKGIKEERLFVLNLLGEGKITADEAANLLETLSSTEQSSYVNWNDDFDAEDKLNKFSKSVENFAKDFSGKIETTFKDMEPKVRKTTKTIMEKTANVIDDISKSLNESINNMEGKMDEEEDFVVDAEEKKEEDLSEIFNTDSDDTPKEN